MHFVQSKALIPGKNDSVFVLASGRLRAGGRPILLEAKLEVLVLIAIPPASQVLRSEEKCLVSNLRCS